MYTLTLNLPWLMSKKRWGFDEELEFSLEKLCPYMTQKMIVGQQLDPDTMPIFSNRLAYQFAKHQEKIPQLQMFKLLKLNPEDGWPLPLFVENFDDLPPGRVLLLLTDFLRGMGDMVMMLPILRAQAKRLAEAGICERISISCSSKFMPFFYGQDFIDEVLSEVPTLPQVAQYAYTTEYGLSMQRMLSLCGLNSWSEADLRVRLFIPPAIEEKWQKRIMGDRLRIFVNLHSFDPARSVPDSLFDRLRTAFPEADFYASIFKNKTQGELFPGGPVNLWPQEQSLFDMCGIIDQMDMVITANTGTAHVAAALGKPTIVYFTGSMRGWNDYWPDQLDSLYPSMLPVGLGREEDKEAQDQLGEVVRLARDVAASVDSRAKGNEIQPQKRIPTPEQTPESMHIPASTKVLF